MEFSLLSGLLNTEVVYMTAGFQLLHHPARLLATTGPGLRRIVGIEKLGGAIFETSSGPALEMAQWSETALRRTFGRRANRERLSSYPVFFDTREISAWDQQNHRKPPLRVGTRFRRSDYCRKCPK
jgi:hypothetical protein